MQSAFPFILSCDFSVKNKKGLIFLSINGLLTWWTGVFFSFTLGKTNPTSELPLMMELASPSELVGLFKISWLSSSLSIFRLLTDGLMNILFMVRLWKVSLRELEKRNPYRCPPKQLILRSSLYAHLLLDRRSNVDYHRDTDFYFMPQIVERPLLARFYGL